MSYQYHSIMRAEISKIDSVAGDRYRRVAKVMRAFTIADLLAQVNAERKSILSDLSMDRYPIVTQLDSELLECIVIDDQVHCPPSDMNWHSV